MSRPCFFGFGRGFFLGVLGEEGVDFVEGSEDGLDLGARDGRELVDGLEVGRVVHGDDKPIGIDPDGDGGVSLGEGFGEACGELRVELNVSQGRDFRAGLFLQDAEF